MSLHPMPSALALAVGRTSSRLCASSRLHVWDAIAENNAPGIHLSDALPATASRYLLEQAPTDNQLVISDRPESWTGFTHLGPDDESIDTKVNSLMERTDRPSLAVVVFDVSEEKWTHELSATCTALLRQGRSCGIYVVVRGGESPDLAEPYFPHSHRFPLRLEQDPGREFPGMVAHYDGPDGPETLQLTAELEPVAN